MPQPVTHTITVEKVTGSRLKLSDGGLTNVNKKDIVEWDVKDGVDITITGITVDSGSHNIFASNATPPTPPQNPSDPPKGPMKGTIADSATGDENYTIHWKNNTTGYHFSMDPTLRVNN